MSENISAEEKTLLQQIKNKEGQINDIFKQLQIKKSDIVRDKSSSQDESLIENNIKNEGLYLQRYADYSIESIRKNYYEALPPFRWFQLPFCKKIVYEKMQFCIPANILILITYGIWRKKTQNTKVLTWKNYGKMYLGLTAVTWALVFAESLIFEPYCDINSHHYNLSLSNLQLAKFLKKQYNRSK